MRLCSDDSVVEPGDPLYVTAHGPLVADSTVDVNLLYELEVKVGSAGGGVVNCTAAGATVNCNGMFAGGAS